MSDLGLTWADRGSLMLRPNKKKEDGPERLAHLFAWEYCASGYLPKWLFDQFYKFTIVRNPYTRLVSEMNFRNVRTGSIEEYVSGLPNDPYLDLWRHVCPQVFYVYDRELNHALIQNVYRFEDLANAFEEICSKAFGRKAKLPFQNKSKRDYWKTTDLTRSDVDYINVKYNADFEAFGYKKL